MEFQKFWKERTRMCFSVDEYCQDCPIIESEGTIIRSCCAWIADHPKKAEEIVQKWSEENPIMTNGQKFKEVFGVSISNFEYSEKWLNQEYKEPQKESD